MNAGEIAKKLCEYSYLKHCNLTRGSNTTYLFEKYWEMNKEYFIARAEIYLDVKKHLEKQ